MEFGTTQYAYFVRSNIIRIYSKVEDYEIENMRQHQIQIRENGGCLDFNFISLLNPMLDEN